jgi:hypothetical protein
LAEETPWLHGIPQEFEKSLALFNSRLTQRFTNPHGRVVGVADFGSRLHWHSNPKLRYGRYTATCRTVADWCGHKLSVPNQPATFRNRRSGATKVNASRQGRIYPRIEPGPMPYACVSGSIRSMISVTEDNREQAF